MDVVAGTALFLVVAGAVGELVIRLVVQKSAERMSLPAPDDRVLGR